MAVKCGIVSSEVVQGRTAYTISVEREGGRQSLLRRHYSDFLALDQEEPVKRLAPESKPTLPPKGRLGLRHRLNLGSFNEQRLEGLRQYLKQLLQTDAAESDAMDRFLTAAPPVEAAPAGSVAALLALEKFLSEDGVPTCSTATPRSDEQASDEEKEARDYRLLPSTGTWLLRPQPRLPAAADAADVAAAHADEATTQEVPQPEPQAEESQVVRSYGLLPSAGAWLLRLPPAAGGSGGTVVDDAAEQEAAPADAAAVAQVDAEESTASMDAAPAVAAEPCEAADANGDAAVPAEVVAQAAEPAADAAPADAPPAAATAKASAKSKGARRRARNKARASGQ